ncbi:ferric reduction oxidase 8 [Planoprotostelium fungivorum]|uniref:Ferric reduction oxidase 8 n=1 Tax=Planoprotostelium fungivorum TaxID=1890364 RepID=A0A2P6NR40_9EUKA|nr:ferric reduction oxidase 8 [Planoprotostelium fungivorum]
MEDTGTYVVEYKSIKCRPPGKGCSTEEDGRGHTSRRRHPPSNADEMNDVHLNPLESCSLLLLIITLFGLAIYTLYLWLWVLVEALRAGLEVNVLQMAVLKNPDGIFQSSGTTNRTVTVTPVMKGHKYLNRLRGYLMWRVPATMLTLDFIIGCIIYATINVVTVIISGETVMRGSASLLSINCFFSSVLAMRNTPLYVLFGWSHDRLAHWHKAMGSWMFVLLATHLGSSLRYIQMNSNIFDAFHVPSYAFGFVSLISMLLLVMIRPSIRQYGRSVLSHLHRMFFVSFVVFGSLHHHKFGYWAIGCGAAFIIDHTIRLAMWAWKRKIIDMRLRGGGLDRVIAFRFPSGRWRNFKPGARVYVNIPGVSTWSWSQVQMVTSAPCDSQCEIVMKVRTDDDEHLVERIIKGYAPNHIRMEGPYGSMGSNWRAYSYVLIIAEGEDLSGCISLLRDAFPYGNPAEVTHKRVSEKLSPCTKTVRLVWSVKNVMQYKWFEEELLGCHEASRDAIWSDASPTFDPIIHSSDRAKLNCPWMRYETVDIRKTFDDALVQCMNRPVLVVVCGNRNLIRTCWDNTARMRRMGKKFNMDYHIF